MGSHHRDETRHEDKGYAQHYKDGVQTRQKKKLVADILNEHQIDLDVWDDLGNALKYFDRMGKKGPIAEDAYKCADYLHRAINGVFLNELK